MTADIGNARADDRVVSPADVVAYALRLGDDALVYAQRMGGWIAAAPQLEEDVALGNIGLDLLGQARSFLTYAGELEGAGRDEDDLAYLRDERDFVNAQIFELPNGDFAFTVARMLVTSAYQVELYTRLATSGDATIAAIAAKAVKEVDYHRDHATQWMLRLGDGTDESHRRMVRALEDVWPYVGELFESDDLTARLTEAGVAADPGSLEDATLEYVAGVLAEATLEVPNTHVHHRGGRRGVHTEHMGYLLAELQYLHRSHPGASW
ncbi:MAG: ring,2-phenylacetyl-CoA epoxidase subunit PaaC [Nocardioidaceae bacterium]|nr:ring,2-phenylacetyl-CoA epoxidase subunit PaaC [Nocardioidaceae bacterium]MDX6309643.1 ring,2-phenylacetyl-CoA epoxidase subunit PaaC [Nocardioidaceae bacterium]